MRTFQFPKIHKANIKVKIENKKKKKSNYVKYSLLTVFLILNAFKCNESLIYSQQVMFLDVKMLVQKRQIDHKK